MDMKQIISLAQLKHNSHFRTNGASTTPHVRCDAITFEILLVISVTLLQIISNTYNSICRICIFL